MKKQIKNIMGYTLMELVIVLSILGILVGIAAPTYISVSRQGKVASIVSRMSLLATAANTAHVACEQAKSAGKSNIEAKIYPLTGPYTATELTLASSDFYEDSCFPALPLLGMMAGSGTSSDGSGSDGVFSFDGTNTWALLIDSRFSVVGTSGTTTTMPTFASSQNY